MNTSFFQITYCQNQEDHLPISFLSVKIFQNSNKNHQFLEQQARGFLNRLVHHQKYGRALNSMMPTVGVFSYV